MGQVIGWVCMFAGCGMLAVLLVLANHGELMAVFSKIGRAIIGPTEIFPTTGWIWQRTHKTLPLKPEPDPTGLFLIDERCPGCLGTGRLRVNILEDDIDEERMWRELELAAHKKWDWEVARTCTGCGLPFLCGKDANMSRDFCETDCRRAYHDRGDRTLGVPVDLDITTHGDQKPQTIKGYATSPQLPSSTLIGDVPIPSRLE